MMIRPIFEHIQLRYRVLLVVALMSIVAMAAVSSVAAQTEDQELLFLPSVMNAPISTNPILIFDFAKDWTSKTAWSAVKTEFGKSKFDS